MDLEKGVVNALVYKRYCLNESCTILWTGEVECIYRSSTKVCEGYEIGWEFVETVNNGKMTFSGFTKFMDSRYQRLSSASKFLCISAFINWWFGWASHTKIYFRRLCAGCGDRSSLLACDGTKVGIGFKNAFIEPIETCHTEDVI